MAGNRRKAKKSVSEKALHKLRFHGPREAARYIAEVMVAKRNPNLVIEGVPEHIVYAARKEAVARIRVATIKKIQAKRAIRMQEERQREEEDRHKREVLKGFLSANDKIRYCAGLPVEDRSILSNITNRNFWQKVTEFRKNCVTAKEAAEILGCSRYQLDKWDKLGLVPHVFTRKIYVSSAGKHVDARFWNVDELKKVDVEKLKNHGREKA